MAGFLPDTSCIVPAVCSWHEHHERAAAEIGRRLDGDEPMILAAPALVESDAALTRLSRPYRLSPTRALTLLETGFLHLGKTVALDAASYHELLQRAAADGVAGGRVYDMVIAWCAIQTGADALLTFNEAHFRQFARPGLEIVVPSSQS